MNKLPISNDILTHINLEEIASTRRIESTCLINGMRIYHRVPIRRKELAPILRVAAGVTTVNPTTT